MVSTLDLLRGISAYPIPERTLLEAARRRGLHLLDDASSEVVRSRGYQLTRADLLVWLSLSPNVMQGGQMYSFSEEQRKALRQQASAIYKDYGEENATTAKPTFGYKGANL